MTETGSIFVQIGDANVHLVRCLLDEVLGSDNFEANIAFRKTSATSSDRLDGTIDTILWYAKARSSLRYRQLYEDKGFGAFLPAAYNRVRLVDGDVRPAGSEELEHGLPPGARLYTLDNLTSSRPAGAGDLRSFEFGGRRYGPGLGTFKSDLAGLQRLRAAGRLESTPRSLRYVRFIDDFRAIPLVNLWTDTAGFMPDKVYVVQTGRKVVERCILMSSDPGDLVLDPTCGSGTTAYVAEQWGRRWITIDTSRVALALARTRVMSARYPYYLLADSEEGIAKESELTGQPPANGKVTDDIKRGFVYARVPHVMLKDIANNEEIDVIHERWQSELEPVLENLNRLLGMSWEEWELPREAEKSWPDEARKLLAEWWRLRRARQKEIDESIARHSETELLYDKPYQDSKRVRVSGPFTVESVSPHRVLSTDEERPQSETAARAEGGAQFATTVIDHLRKAGVTNTKKGERLKFDRLDSYAGEWLHAEGEYTDADREQHTVAVSIGPEHGTVGPEQVKDAAKEAVRGVGFDVLVVCGFAFDAHVGEETRRYGKLTILPAKMDMSLAMGDDVLKKTGTENLFMVFGEPDIEMRRDGDGKVVVEVRGVDVFDPTTGQVRSSSTDDIACWFIDTNYNEESFFVRHAYFLGADEPYDKLKRTLRAEIDEEAWASLYSTTSRPFDPPSTGKIAVKVINHYGDEVLKVYPVD